MAAILAGGMEPLVISTIITVGGAIALVAANWLRERGKDKGDRFNDLVHAYDELADNMRQDMTRVRDQNRECEERLGALEFEMHASKERHRECLERTVVLEAEIQLLKERIP